MTNKNEIEKLRETIEKLNESLSHLSKNPKKVLKTIDSNKQKLTYSRFLGEQKTPLFEKVKEAAFKTSLGRWVVSTSSTIKMQFTETFQRLGYLNSNLMQKMFGPLLEDLSPIIDGVKLVGSLALSSLKFLTHNFKTFGKSIFSKISEKFKSFGKELIEKLIKKKDDTIITEKKKQTNQLDKTKKILKWINFYQKILAKNTSYLSKQGMLDWSERIDRLRRKGIKKDDKEPILPDVVKPMGFISTLVDGSTKIWNIIKSAFSLLFSLFSSALPLLIATPLIGLLLKVFDKEGIGGSWLNKNIIKPLLSFFEDTAFPFIKKFFITEVPKAAVEVAMMFSSIMDGLLTSTKNKRAADEKLKEIEKQDVMLKSLIEKRNNVKSKEEKEKINNIIKNTRESQDLNIKAWQSLQNLADVESGIITGAGQFTGAMVGGTIILRGGGLSTAIKAGVASSIVAQGATNYVLQKFSKGGVVSPSSTNIITSPFGTRFNKPKGGSDFHKGIDFRGNSSTPVMSVMDGVVQSTGSTWGNITIGHDNGLSSSYTHLSSINVKNGDNVSVGQRIGMAGDKRDTNIIPIMAPHLHFGMFQNGRPINPEPFLSQNGISLSYKSGVDKSNDKIDYNSWVQQPNKINKEKSFNDISDVIGINELYNLFSTDELLGSIQSGSNIPSAEKTTSADIGQKRSELTKANQQNVEQSSSIITGETTTTIVNSSNLTQMVKYA